MPDNAIETEHLTKRFRRVRGYADLLRYPWMEATELAVDDMTFNVRKGELFGLLGENGAGKTTLIRMLCTTLLPTSGNAMVGGHDVVADPHAVRRIIGLVSGDERTFYWRISGRQNLEYFAALYHLQAPAARRRIDELLDILDIGTYADRRFDSYSTGIRQKFGIARGMLTEPELLFLDEPTRALDPIAAAELRRHVREHIVGELGRTVLIATHTLTEAEEICDRIAIMRHGALVEVGSMDDLRQRMHLATRVDMTFRGDSEALEAALLAISEVETVSRGGENGLTHLELRLGAAQEAMDRVVQAAAASGVNLQNITSRQPTLEDVYWAAHAPD